MTDQIRDDLLQGLQDATTGRGVPAGTLQTFAELLDVDQFTDANGAVDPAAVQSFADATFRIGKSTTPPAPRRSNAARRGIDEVRRRFGETATEQRQRLRTEDNA